MRQSSRDEGALSDQWNDVESKADNAGLREHHIVGSCIESYDYQKLIRWESKAVT